MDSYIIGQVYFSTTKNRFIQVRAMHDDFFTCGGFCEYFNDSMTTILFHNVSKDYLDTIGLVKVNALDKLGFGVNHNGIGWRVTDDES